MAQEAGKITGDGGGEVKYNEYLAWHTLAIQWMAFNLDLNPADFELGKRIIGEQFGAWLELNNTMQIWGDSLFGGKIEVYIS